MEKIEIENDSNDGRRKHTNLTAYLLPVVMLRLLLFLLLAVVVISLGIGHDRVGHDDGGPAQTLGVHV